MGAATDANRVRLTSYVNESVVCQDTRRVLHVHQAVAAIWTPPGGTPQVHVVTAAHWDSQARTLAVPDGWTVEVLDGRDMHGEMPPPEPASGSETPVVAPDIRPTSVPAEELDAYLRRKADEEVFKFCLSRTQHCEGTGALLDPGEAVVVTLTSATGESRTFTFAEDHWDVRKRGLCGTPVRLGAYCAARARTRLVPPSTREEGRPIFPDSFKKVGNPPALAAGAAF
jgi:hypothetical protein